MKKSNMKNKISLFKKFFLMHLIFLFCLTIFNKKAEADDIYPQETEMQNVFICGGYGALFGAIMGTAILPFMDKSAMQNLRIIAGGASIGFMAGSAYGFYSISQPKKNDSFFNSEGRETGDTPFYNGMPPTLPSESYVAPKKNSPLEKQKLKVGSLIMGSTSKIYLGVPSFWLTQNSFGVMLANISL